MRNKKKTMSVKNYTEYFNPIAFFFSILIIETHTNSMFTTQSIAVIQYPLRVRFSCSRFLSMNDQLYSLRLYVFPTFHDTFKTEDSNVLVTVSEVILMACSAICQTCSQSGVIIYRWSTWSFGDKCTSDIWTGNVLILLRNESLVDFKIDSFEREESPEKKIETGQSYSGALIILRRWNMDDDWSLYTRDSVHLQILCSTVENFVLIFIKGLTLFAWRYFNSSYSLSIIKK